MRQLVNKNYNLLRYMLDETHSLKANVLLTHNYQTSKVAHQRLEIIMKRKCEKVVKIDYGL